ncbi:hypothetical protein BDB01DRAFT_467306 [Pilobolus umbonatus]|nr:hypothetical protein BDB01DRAFT_467306 [Pilobolus umbonatus]
MEHLSVELLQQVIKCLNSNAIYHCITVNKTWYATAIRYLYNYVNPQDSYHQRLLMKSMTLYPRCSGAGIYVKKLNIRRIYRQEEDPLDIFTQTMDVLSYYPNIKHLSLPRDDYAVQCLLSDRMTYLKSLKKISFDHGTLSYEIQIEILECSHRFRSTLIFLDLTNLAKALEPISYTQLQMYLQSFPLLTGLWINEPSSLRYSTLFDSIFSWCPCLTHLYYSGHHKRSLDESNASYPNMKNLTLVLLELDMNYIRFIKNRLTSITHLTISFEIDFSLSRNSIMPEIMSIPTLQKFTAKFRPNNESTNKFWVHQRQFMTYPFQNIKNRLLFFQVQGSGD